MHDVRNTWDCKLDSSVGFTTKIQGRLFPGFWSWFREWLSMSGLICLPPPGYVIVALISVTSDVQDRRGWGEGMGTSCCAPVSGYENLSPGVPWQEASAHTHWLHQGPFPAAERIGKESNIVMIN